MAQLKDAKHVIQMLGIVEFGKRVWQQTNEDDVFTWAASLAYSWIFAIFPFLIFLLTLAPLMPTNAQAEVKRDLHSSLKVLSKNAAAPIEHQVDDLLSQPRQGLLSIGLLVTIWAASGGMSMTMSALDRCYDIREGRPYIQHRIVAILLTVVGASLVLVVMVLMPVASGLIAWADRHGSILGPILPVLNLFRFGFAMLLMLGLLSLVYHWGVSIHIKFHFFTPGAVFSMLVWVILALTFRLYINRFGEASYNKTYGTVAGVAILLLFFYIDASVLLIGAEINSEIDFAMLGLSTSDSEKAHTIPIRQHHTEDQRILLTELKKKREPEPPSEGPTTVIHPIEPGPIVKPKVANNAIRAASLLATAGATWAFFKAFRELRHASFEKQRLKQLYPLTYQAIFKPREK